MDKRTGGVIAVLTAGILFGTAAHVQANELGFLEMLFGGMWPNAHRMRSAPVRRHAYRPPERRLGFGRHRFQTRYAALPVKIRVGDRPAGDRQVAIDMKGGAAAALMKDETLRPGDIVVLNTGARVFTGEPDKQHTMDEFEPVQRSAYVSKSTRRLLAGMVAPVGAIPAEEARRVVVRIPSATPDPAISDPAAPSQAAAMRVINPWRANP